MAIFTRCSASFSAIPRPMPRELPVIRACFTSGISTSSRSRTRWTALADARFGPLVPHAGRADRGAAEGSRLRVALQPAEVLVADLDRLLVRSGAKDDAVRFGERGVDDDRQPEEAPEGRLCSGLAAGEEALELLFTQ